MIQAGDYRPTYRSTAWYKGELSFNIEGPSR